MSKNTIIRFPEEMSMERALNHNMDWTIRQLRTLTRITNGLNNGLLCVSLGLGLMAILWGKTEKEVDKLQAENRLLAREIDDVKDRSDILETRLASIEFAEEGRTQM